MGTAGPAVDEEMTAVEAVESTFGAAGSGKAEHILLDHYVMGSPRGL
jgi:hypothetical protein